jgi:hypothetical protein
MGKRRLDIYLCLGSDGVPEEENTRTVVRKPRGSLTFRSKAAAWPGAFARSIQLKGNRSHNSSAHGIGARRGCVKEDTLILILKYR